MVPRVARVTRWAGVVALWMHAAGVEASRPAAIRRAVSVASPARPISTTSVSTPATPDTSGLSASVVWPVITANDRAVPRTVTGIPAAAGPAIALLTPGAM